MEQQPFQQPSYQVPPAMPKNWLVESILVTIFCCLPFGIAGIVFASQVNSKYAAGDHTGAVEASKNAAKWTKIGFFVGLAVLVVYMIAIFGLGLTGFWMAKNGGNQ
ncbi:MAG: CD225/dispanin family protein [Chitinophagaceae bacterium]|nr:CD225/dispanin family protein [Chitinophagaceae bacterium]